MQAEYSSYRRSALPDGAVLPSLHHGLQLLAHRPSKPRPVPILSVTGVGAFGDIAQLRMVGSVRRASDQHESPVAIATIDIAMLVDLEIDPRVAKRGWTIARPTTNSARAIARDAARFDAHDFGGRYVGHGSARLLLHHGKFNRAYAVNLLCAWCRHTGLRGLRPCAPPIWRWP